MSIIDKQQILQRTLEKAKQTLANSPEGSINFYSVNGSNQFYLRTPNKTRKYISRKDFNTISSLAQKYYCKELVKKLEPQNLLLLNFIKNYQTISESNVFEDMPKCLKPYISSFNISDDEYADFWEKKSFKSKDISDDTKTCTTAKGEKVRSKSEWIIADKLFSKGIKYRYEQAHFIKGFGLVYPDFTVLNKHTREEIIFEHFGMVDKPEYFESMIKKLNSYAKAGIYWGHGFVCTFETEHHSLDSEMLNWIIDKYFLSKEEHEL